MFVVNINVSEVFQLSNRCWLGPNILQKSDIETEVCDTTLAKLEVLHTPL